VTANHANHAKKEADWGFPSRIWRISRLNLFAPRRRPLSDLCVPVVKMRATTPRCPVSFRQQSQFPPAATIPRSSASMAGVPESEMPKTNPISPVGQGPSGRNVRNKPKPGHPGVSVERDAGRRANAPNEPNFRPARYPTTPLFHHSRPMPVVQTNPIGARQSRQTNPIAGGAGWGEAGGAWDEGQMRKTNPICRGLPCETKPIPAKWWLYKQTQFRPVGIPAIPLLHHSGIPARGQSCETKPIWPVGQSPAGRNARNKPNSGPDRFGPCLCVKQTQFRGDALGGRDSPVK
jgi:hypothetical protein